MALVIRSKSVAISLLAIRRTKYRGLVDLLLAGRGASVGRHAFRTLVTDQR